MKELKSGLSRLKCDMDFDVYARFDTLTLKIDGFRAETRERLDQIDERLDKLEQRVGNLEQRVDKLEQRMDTSTDQIVNLVAPMFEAIYTRLDARLSAIEKKLGL